MKYEFVKIDSDTTELSYKDKVFTIKRDVDLEKRVQEAIPRSRILMSAELAKMGMTKKDLVIERHEEGKTYYDNSNILEVEEEYRAVAINQIYDEITKKYCGMTLTELMQDIGLDINSASKENEEFGIAYTRALTGEKEETFPSESKEEI